MALQGWQTVPSCQPCNITMVVPGTTIVVYLTKYWTAGVRTTRRLLGGVHFCAKGAHFVTSAPRW